VEKAVTWQVSSKYQQFDVDWTVWVAACLVVEQVWVTLTGEVLEYLNHSDSHCTNSL